MVNPAKDQFVPEKTVFLTRLKGTAGSCRDSGQGFPVLVSERKREQEY